MITYINIYIHGIYIPKYYYLRLQYLRRSKQYICCLLTNLKDNITRPDIKNKLFVYERKVFPRVREI